MISIITNRKEQTRFLRFLVVGIIGAIVDFGILNLLIVVFLIPFEFAQAISFTCAVISNFIWNRYWTYPDSRSKSMRRQLVQFFVVNIAGLAIRSIVITLLHTPFIRLFASIIPSNFFLSSEFFGNNFTVAFAVIVVMMWNFFVNRYWTYSDVD